MEYRSRVRTGLAAVAALCAVAAAPAQAPAPPLAAQGAPLRAAASPVRSAGSPTGGVTAPGSTETGGAPVDSVSEVPEYRNQGKPIEGTSGSTGAPQIQAGSSYVDHIASGEELHYSVKLDGTSTAYVSAVAAPAPGTEVSSYQDGVSVLLESASGEKCGGSTEKIVVDDVAYPLADYADRQIASPHSVGHCQRAGTYLVTVERTGTGSSAANRWPLELRLLEEPPVHGGATAQPPRGSWPSEAPELSGDSVRERSGGTGFNDARPLATGRWRDTIRPGETRFYRLPVDWGQQIFAAAELSATDGGGAGAGRPSYVGDALGLRVYNPARGLVKGGDFAAYQGRRAQSQVATAAAAYGNREEAADRSVRAMSVSGWYYLAVTLSPETAEFFPDGAPLTLRTQIVGAVAEGPHYRGDPLAAGFGISEGDRRSAQTGQSAGGSGSSDGGRGDRLRLVGYAGFGFGGLLLLGLGLWTWIVRRRAAGKPPAVGSGGSPGGPPASGPAVGPAGAGQSAATGADRLPGQSTAPEGQDGVSGPGRPHYGPPPGW